MYGYSDHITIAIIEVQMLFLTAALVSTTFGMNPDINLNGIYIREENVYHLNCTTSSGVSGCSVEFYTNDTSFDDIRFVNGKCVHQDGECQSNKCICSSDCKVFQLNITATASNSLSTFGCGTSIAINDIDTNITYNARTTVKRDGEDFRLLEKIIYPSYVGKICYITPLIPTQGNGTLPTQGNGTLPTQGNGTLPTQGNGTLSTQGNGTLPTQGNGTLSTQGNRTLPTQGNGTLSTQGNGTLPTHGNGTFNYTALFYIIMVITLGVLGVFLCILVVLSFYRKGFFERKTSCQTKNYTNEQGGIRPNSTVSTITCSSSSSEPRISGEIENRHHPYQESSTTV